MLSRTSTLQGGENYGEDVLIPRKGEESILFQLTTRVVEDYEMPPKEADKLSQQQSLWIRDWINAGAPWPDKGRIKVIQNQFAEGVKAPTSGGLDDEWSNRRYNTEHLWAYRPLKVKSPVASPLIFDKTSSPKGLKAFNSNSSRLTLTSIFGLVSEKSKVPLAKILFTRSLSKEKLTSYIS